MKNLYWLIVAATWRLRFGDVAAFENRQPIAAAKFINKSSLFVLLLGVIRRLELKPNSKQKVENIFVAPPIAKPPVGCWAITCYSPANIVFTSLALEELLNVAKTAPF